MLDILPILLYILTLCTCKSNLLLTLAAHGHLVLQLRNKMQMCDAHNGCPPVVVAQMITPIAQLCVKCFILYSNSYDSLYQTIRLYKRRTNKLFKSRLNYQSNDMVIESCIHQMNRFREESIVSFSNLCISSS